MKTPRMDSRRDFIKKAALLSGTAGLSGALPSSIQKAFAIDPDKGTSYLDAEHVVILMQENRSFDHTFGSLRGVRGFNDPRAISLPNKNKVWLQTDEKGHTYVPFRYNLKDTKITWMSSLPHRWEDQTDARHHGRYDKWLEIKKSGNPEYRSMPLPLGYYTREDVPFYYALADAFTICDQNFCSSLTGTTPNRLYHWTGTLREKPDPGSKANVRNSDVDYGRWASWTTFPERLEDNGISWKIYQNELSLDKGLPFEEQEWLCNFTDNPIEWFEQYHVRFSPGYHDWLLGQRVTLPGEVAAMRKKLEGFSGGVAEKKDMEDDLAEKEAFLAGLEEEIRQWAPEGYGKLDERTRALHEKAFTLNSRDPHYHELLTHTYSDAGTERSVRIPKGDILHQFREDVENGKLPAVSWLVAPARFSDHPGGPWYGVWYLSEVMDILTKDPEVWKKTIFILNYDENDGYFDHVPPFVAPDPAMPGSGKASAHIDTGVEQVAAWQEIERARKNPEDAGTCRTGPIGLGYRVPLIVASPWSRGGAVCSEIFDHTSVLQFLGKFLSHKTGRHIGEPNISEWRRTVCGDLSSVFTPYHGEQMPDLQPVNKEQHVELIMNAQFRPVISNFAPLTPEEIAVVNKDPRLSPHMPLQEKGIRPARPLSYQLYTESRLEEDKTSVGVSFHVSREVFGDTAAGCPFIVYATGTWKDGPWHGGNPVVPAAWRPVHEMRVWNYTVAAGDTVSDSWTLGDFDQGVYRLEIYGPNGYYRVFAGDARDPLLEIACEYQRSRWLKKHLTGNLQLHLKNMDKGQAVRVTITDNAYGAGPLKKVLGRAGTGGAEEEVAIDCSRSYGWYDITVRVEGNGVFEKRYAGHVETGRESFSDPLMGGVPV